jgi:ankyrin repeat protein
MRLVVEAGADVNARDNAGCTALHLAAQNGFRAIVEFLLSRSTCDPSITDLFGRNAASYAITAHPDIAELITREV